MYSFEARFRVITVVAKNGAGVVAAQLSRGDGSSFLAELGVTHRADGI